jgi:hypothetical protein
MSENRELDAQVAERVMEWTGFTHNGRIGYPPDADPNHVLPSVVPKYSESIEAAMQVVEKMRGLKWDVQITSDDESPAWQVSFDARDAVGRIVLGEHESDSLPEAICRAADAALTAVKDQNGAEVK